MYSEEIDDNLQIIPIRDKLSKMLGKFVPEVHDELAATLEDEFHVEGDGDLFISSVRSGLLIVISDWKSFVALPTIINTIARVSNRVLVGLPLCEWNVAHPERRVDRKNIHPIRSR
jgi:hypothetical protein